MDIKFNIRELKEGKEHQIPLSIGEVRGYALPRVGETIAYNNQSYTVKQVIHKIPDNSTIRGIEVLVQKTD